MPENSIVIGTTYPSGRLEGSEMTAEEQARRDALFEVKVHEFAQAMDAHWIGGEYHYYLTEMMVMWPDIGYDAEHAYILN
jgi:hypothetical protein